MSAVTFTLLCVVALTAAEDFVDWKKTSQDRKYTERVQPLYQGVHDDLDSCILEVEGTRGAKVVQYHNTTKVCQLFSKFDTADDALTTTTAGTNGFTLYYEAEREKETHTISTEGIIATCVLAPIFLICLIVLAILCKSEAVDISKQLADLEHAEVAKEEAVSEHFEKKSLEAEADAAARKEVPATD